MIDIFDVVKVLIGVIIGILVGYRNEWLSVYLSRLASAIWRWAVSLFKR